MTEDRSNYSVINVGSHDDGRGEVDGCSGDRVVVGSIRSRRTGRGDVSLPMTRGRERHRRQKKQEYGKQEAQPRNTTHSITPVRPAEESVETPASTEERCGAWLLVCMLLAICGEEENDNP